jgi:hypothetical protein
MSGIILNSPQCGGTHAFIRLLKSLGLKLVGRHRGRIWYEIGIQKDKALQNGIKITEGFELPIKDGQFISGHSGPFETEHKVVSVRRDPRNVMLCHHHRRGLEQPFDEWLLSLAGIKRAKIIPQMWDWHGTNVLPVWYEQIRSEAEQKRVAQFCGVEWQASQFWGDSKTWSGNPSDWRKEFDRKTTRAWERLWLEISGEDFLEWLDRN